MDSIPIQCCEGHRLRAPIALAGKNVRCPKCQALTQVPTTIQVPTTASPARATNTLSDTGVMRILGDADNLPPPPRVVRGEPRPCNRCGKEMGRVLAVCPHCACYVGYPPDYLRRLETEPGTIAS